MILLDCATEERYCFALQTIHLVPMIHICHLKQGYSWPKPTIHGLMGILGNRMPP